jgi:hypothetical protein
MSDRNTGDYEIGYGKPPQYFKWKKGFCPNPKGRPKGSKNLKTDLREVLAETVQVKEGNKTKKLSKQRLVIVQLVNRAIKGSDAAAAKLLELHIKAFGIGDEAGDAERPLTAEEREILAFVEARFLKAEDTSGPAAKPDPEPKR